MSTQTTSNAAITNELTLSYFDTDTITAQVEITTVALIEGPSATSTESIETVTIVVSSEPTLT